MQAKGFYTLAVELGCMQDQTQEQLESLAEEFEVSYEQMESVFQDNLEEVNTKSASLSEAKKEELALRFTRASEVSERRNPTEEVEILTIGHGGIRQWNNYDENGNVVGEHDVLIGFGLIEQDDTPHVSAVILDEEDGVEIPFAYDAFSEMGNIVTGEFSVGESDLDRHLVANSSSSTEISVQEPPNREGMVSEIRNSIPEFNIENIAENMSATTVEDDGSEYPTDFGVDLKMIEADVYDAYKSSDFGIYTLRDETVFDDEDVADSPIYDEESRTPGLTCWIDPEMMEYGNGSVCEFFGTVTQNDDGQIQFNAVNVNPIFPQDFDGTVDTTGSSDEENVETEADTMEI